MAMRDAERLIAVSPDNALAQHARIALWLAASDVEAARNAARDLAKQRALADTARAAEVDDAGVGLSAEHCVEELEFADAAHELGAVASLDSFAQSCHPASMSAGAMPCASARWPTRP